MKIKILANDNNGEGNVDIKKFFDKYIKDLLKKGVRFDFKIVTKSDIKKLRKKGVTGLPAMMIKKKTIVGPDKMKKHLMGILGITHDGPSAPPPPQRAKTAEEDLRDYQMNIMTMDAYENDKNGGDDFAVPSSDEYRAKAEAMASSRRDMHKQERERVGMRSEPPSTRVKNIDVNTTALQDIKNSVGNSKDDQMLADMFDVTEDDGGMDMDSYLDEY